MTHADFETAYTEWLRARAALAECDTDALDRLPPAKADEVMNEALDTLRAAEWRLLQTPAGSLSAIRGRAEIVIEMFAAADMRGEPTASRHFFRSLLPQALPWAPDAPSHLTITH
jgi:hypothetical protein